MRFLALALLAIALNVPAAPDAKSPELPKSPKAKAAIKKYERALDAAKAEHDRATAAARKELNGQLDAAIKDAMKAGTLDEAKRIEAAKVEAEGDAGATATRLEKELVDMKWQWHAGARPVISFSSKGWHDPHWGDKYGPVRVRDSRTVDVLDPTNGVKREIVFDSQLKGFVFVGSDDNVVLGTRVAGK